MRFDCAPIRRSALFVLCGAMSLSLLSGCPNAFTELSNKKSDEALLYQAKMLIDDKDWSGAVTTLQEMTPAGAELRGTKHLLASAYAGRCGLNLLSLAKSVADGMSAGTKLWPVLMTAMRTRGASDVADCQAAEQTLLSIEGDPANRTADENVLLAFVEFTKMGAVLANSTADADDDGVLDGGFDPCSTSSLTDAEAQELGTGITNSVLSLAASGGGVATDTTTVVTSMCSTIDTVLTTLTGSPVTGFCNQNQASDFDATEILVIRALLKSNEVGFGTCGGAVGSSVSCLCN